MRDILVLELLFGTGLRVSELCALTNDTFVLSENELQLLVKGKGQKERIIQVSTPELVYLSRIYYQEWADELYGKTQSFLIDWETRFHHSPYEGSSTSI